MLGNSIVKRINGWEISKRLWWCKVYVKHFPGAKTHCMKGYLKSPSPQNASHFILHVGTIDLKSEKPSKAIVKEIMNIAVSPKSEVHYVSVSNIKVRTDNQQSQSKSTIILLVFVRK